MVLEIESGRQPRPPTLADSLVAVAALIALVAASFLLFGEDAALGPNQVALTLAATLAAGLAWKNGHAWDDIRKAVVDGVASALPAIFILFAVGALIGTWAMSGTLVAMVYYALGVLSPTYFYLSACAVCALVAVCIGSSWTVVATIGLGLMGVAAEMHLSPAVTAGAVISGAYFGDKMSPLSDTVNLAAAAAGAQLFDHIRLSLVTSIPALLLAFVGFWLLGSPGEFDTSSNQAALAARYDVTAWAFVPVVVVVVLSVLRVPPFLAILGGALAGGVFAIAAAAGSRAATCRQARSADLDRAAQGRLAGAGDRLCLSERRSGPGHPTVARRHGEHAQYGLADHGRAGLWRGARARRHARADRGSDRRLCPLDRGVGRDLVAAAIGMNVVAGDQYLAVVLPGACSSSSSRGAAWAPAAVARARRFRHGDLAASAVEQLRRLYVGDPRGLRTSPICPTPSSIS